MGFVSLLRHYPYLSHSMNTEKEQYPVTFACDFIIGYNYGIS